MMESGLATRARHTPPGSGQGPPKRRGSPQLTFSRPIRRSSVLHRAPLRRAAIAGGMLEALHAQLAEGRLLVDPGDAAEASTLRQMEYIVALLEAGPLGAAHCLSAAPRHGGEVKESGRREVAFCNAKLHSRCLSVIVLFSLAVLLPSFPPLLPLRGWSRKRVRRAGHRQLKSCVGLRRITSHSPSLSTLPFPKLPTPRTLRPMPATTTSLRPLPKLSLRLPPRS